MEAYTFTRTFPVRRNYDLIVAGGGVAGCAAAVTAAKRGVSVLLIEKSNILGGLGTLGLVNLFVPMCNGRGKQIIFGLAEEWLRLSARLGYDTIPAPWKNGEPTEPTEVRYTQRYSPYIFAMQLSQEVRAAGVDLLLDCQGTEAVMDGKVCRGVITDSKSGLELYGCRFLIDTTGDADLMRRAGLPCAAGQNYYSYFGKQISLDSIRKALESGNIAKAFTSFSGGKINLFGDHQPEDVPRWSGLTVEEVTDYLVTNQDAMLAKLSEEDRTAREIAMLPLMPNFRTTCRLQGDYTFTVGDAYRHFDDSVCAINDFEHRDHLFEIPLRALCRADTPNILTAGRSVSAAGYGWDLVRVIPPAILTGQAAGEAAALALSGGTSAAEVDIRTLQRRLEAGNVMIHFPDSYVPEDRTVVIHGKNAAGIDGGHF